MKSLGRISLSAAIWMALLAPNRAQIDGPIAVPPRKDFTAPAPAAQAPAAPPPQAQAPVFIRDAVILNGNNVIIANGPVSVGNAAPEEKVAPDPAGPQVLEFQSGEKLHGALEALDMARGLVLWRRPDAPAPLLIPLEEINRWRTDAKPPIDARSRSTIKFNGGDWLVGELTALQGERVQWRIPDGPLVSAGRAHVEWIYFSKTGAIETYDGPTSLSGWLAEGAWTYRDGALRSTGQLGISRMFQALPDQVEYRMLIDPGDLVNSFNLSLHARGAAPRGLDRGMIQLSLRTSSLNVWGSSDGAFKMFQTDLTKLLGKPAERARQPVLLQVFEDGTSGRLLVYLNRRKMADWTMDKREPGKNGGAVQFQPTSSSGEEQSVSKIQVIPWDGREPGEDNDRTSDEVAVSDGKFVTGKIAGWDGQTMGITTERGSTHFPAENVKLLRFQRALSPPEDDGPVARVRLAAGGEFDAVKLDWREGKFQFRTNFGGVLPFAAASVTEITFNRPETKSATTGDVLVFRNGDRLRGSLEQGDGGGALRWKSHPTEPPVDFTGTHIAGVQFAPRPTGAEADGTVARFRNGDWLPGKMEALDTARLVLQSGALGRITAPRAQLKALYFSAQGAPAVSDAASDHEIWERGLDLTGNSERKTLRDVRSPWSYFGGSYSLTNGEQASAAYQTGNLQFGRSFSNLPPRVEVSLRITSQKMPVFCNALLFSTPSGLGHGLDMSPVGLTLFGRGNRQQFSFGKEIAANAFSRTLQILADRPTGRLTILVDGVLVAQVSPKSSQGARDLGNGILISSQPAISPTVAEIWVGPWNGLIPGKGPPSKDAPAVVAMANGDEVLGTVEWATDSQLNVASEIGSFDLPVNRTTMVDFGGPSAQSPIGTRLHLAGQGALTVENWRMIDGSLTCESEIFGELRLPIEAVQEMVFASPAARAEE